MRTINFNEEDIKQCKLALAMQNLTSLQSEFLMQYITNIEQENEQLKSIIYELREHMLDIDYKMAWQYVEYLDRLLPEKLLKEVSDE